MQSGNAKAKDDQNRIKNNALPVSHREPRKTPHHVLQEILIRRQETPPFLDLGKRASTEQVDMQSMDDDESENDPKGKKESKREGKYNHGYMEPKRDFCKEFTRK